MKAVLRPCLLLVSAMTACQSPRFRADGFTATDDQTKAAVPGPASDPAVGGELGNVAGLIEARRRLLESIDAPARFVRQHCPDDELVASAPKPSSRVLWFTSQDGRSGARGLLPADLTELLVSPELRSARERIELGGREGPKQPGLVKVSVDRGALEAVSRRPWAGVYHITEYREPRLVYRLSENRRKWLDGELAAQLIVYDVERGSVLCQTPIRVHAIVEGASIRLTAKEPTALALIRELGWSLRRETREALANISSSLRLPEDWDHSDHMPR
jgi:hypothetical protein